MNLRVLLLALAALVWAGATVQMAKAAPGVTNAMRRGPLSEQLPPGSFRVEPGFRLELAAEAPMVSAPVAMAFDENGRLFVVEMRDYPNNRSAQPHLGRVRLLEEPNDQGVYQTSTIFADDLPLPSAIACYGGGIFVAAAPDVLFFKATHEGGADVKKLVLTGFGGDAIPDAQHLPNNFKWGPNDRLYGATAGIGGAVTAPGWGGGRTPLEGCDFSFNPRTLAVTPEAGPAQSGLCFDSFGREFVSGPTHPLQQVRFELRYRARNPFYPALPPLKDVASPATEIFHFDASASGRAARGPAAPGGVRAARPANGLAPGWLGQARGCVIYRGDSFSSNYFGNVFIADPENHLVHRALLRDNGHEIVALRAPNELNTEFLVAQDNSFQPAQIVNGPDGALYVADFQGGGERGRIFRIVPENFKRAKLPKLGSAKTPELLATLAHPNGWQRDTAARLLFEQQDPAATPLLAQMSERARSPVVRLKALQALAAAGGFRETNALSVLGDPDARVREAAIQLCEPLIVNGMVSDELWGQFRALAADPDLGVRRRLAFTVGDIRRPDKTVLLAQVLSRDLRNPEVQNAVLSSVADNASSLLNYLASNSALRNDPAGRQFLRQLALMIGLQGRLPDTMGVMNYVANSSLDWDLRFALLAELGEGLHRTRSSFTLIDPQNAFLAIYQAALQTAETGAAPERMLVDSTRLLGSIPLRFEDTADWLALQCTPQPFHGLQSAAVATLCSYDDPRVLSALLAYWPAMTPALRQETVTALLSRVSRLRAVLDAVQKHQIAAADVSSTERNLLRTFRDPNISQWAVRLFGPVPQQRPQVIQQSKEALRLRGGAEHGQQIYAQRCAACHQPDTTGAALGPSLAGARTRGRERVLEAILQPNAAVPPQYAACVVETKDGEILIGIKTDDNPLTLTLRQMGGPAVWPQLNVQSAKTQSWSLMPDGLEEGLAPQDLADLLEWVMGGAGTAQPP